MNNVSDKTLHAILTNAGIFTPVADACVSGRLSRTFGNRDVTLAWKTREAYYWLAEESVVGTEQITIAKIIFKIMPEWSQGEFALDGLTATAHQVRFYRITYKNYCWLSPAAGYVSYLTPRELMAAIRLYYIYTIWQNAPSFLEADFSTAVQNFDNNAVAGILERHRPTVPALTAAEKKLLNFLAEAPRSRREMEIHMNMKRGYLLTNALNPAREAGWITTTDTSTPSSPSQRYTLTEAGKQAAQNN